MNRVQLEINGQSTGGRVDSVMKSGLNGLRCKHYSEFNEVLRPIINSDNKRQLCCPRAFNTIYQTFNRLKVLNNRAAHKYFMNIIYLKKQLFIVLIIVIRDK